MRGTPVKDILRHDAPLQMVGSTLSGEQPLVQKLVTDTNAALAIKGYETDSPSQTSQSAFAAAAGGEYTSRPDLGISPSEITVDQTGPKDPEQSEITFDNNGGFDFS